MQDRKIRNTSPENYEANNNKGGSGRLEPFKNTTIRAINSSLMFTSSAASTLAAATVIGCSYALFSGIGGGMDLTGFAKVSAGVVGTALACKPVAKLSAAFFDSTMKGAIALANKLPSTGQDYYNENVIKLGVYTGTLSGLFLVGAMVVNDFKTPEVEVLEPPVPEMIIENQAELNGGISNENYDASGGLENAYLIKKNAISLG